MKILHIALFIIFVHFSYGSLNPRRTGIFNRNPNDPALILELSRKLQSITPGGLKHEERMALVKLTKVRSKNYIYGVIWFYEFQARGLSSSSMYDCSLVMKKTSRVVEFDCKLREH